VNPGDVVLVHLHQAVGPAKLRPALVLSILPGPYGDLLLCGISTQLRQQVKVWVIQKGEAVFGPSGLRQTSLIRLSFLRSVAPGAVGGVIGQIEPARLERLQTRLADHLRP
jgi:mRNA-degrading endonuclease toxin of MazEF toxin-antitoxin module